MNRMNLVLVASLLLLVACQGDPASEEQPPAADAPVGTEGAGVVVGESEVSTDTYGTAITLTEAIQARELISSPETYADKLILVEGTVVDVCQKMGCWLVLSDGERQIRVTMKDHGFSVRKDGSGAFARIEGTLRHVAPDPDRTAHLESESKRPDLLPEKSGLEYELVATGVALTGAPSPS